MPSAARPRCSRHRARIRNGWNATRSGSDFPRAHPDLAPVPSEMERLADDRLHAVDAARKVTVLGTPPRGNPDNPDSGAFSREARVVLGTVGLAAMAGGSVDP